MGRTSTQAKQEWNSRHYSQVKVSINPDTAAAFKAACAAAGVSMASAISCFMESYSHTATQKNGYAPELCTRRQRRAALANLVQQIERIRDNEELYRGRIPENLQSSDVYGTAEQCVASLDEALELLASAF